MTDNSEYSPAEQAFHETVHDRLSEIFTALLSVAKGDGIKEAVAEEIIGGEALKLAANCAFDVLNEDEFCEYAAAAFAMVTEFIEAQPSTALQ